MNLLLLVAVACCSGLCLSGPRETLIVLHHCVVSRLYLAFALLGLVQAKGTEGRRNPGLSTLGRAADVAQELILCAQLAMEILDQILRSQES